jgi:hypothetical protein
MRKLTFKMHISETKTPTKSVGVRIAGRELIEGRVGKMKTIDLFRFSFSESSRNNLLKLFQTFSECCIVSKRETFRGLRLEMPHGCLKTIK